MLLLLSAPRAGLRPARPPWGSTKLGAARRFLESAVLGEISPTIPPNFPQRRWRQLPRNSPTGILRARQPRDRAIVLNCCIRPGADGRCNGRKQTIHSHHPHCATCGQPRHSRSGLNPDPLTRASVPRCEAAAAGAMASMAAPAGGPCRTLSMRRRGGHRDCGAACAQGMPCPRSVGRDAALRSVAGSDGVRHAPAGVGRETADQIAQSIPACVGRGARAARCGAPRAARARAQRPCTWLTSTSSTGRTSLVDRSGGKSMAQ
ncbi:hypothetical protein GALL_278180 [mine drainage metagenome]|uniref:Uncharacterized protein n=1 Tax=mine drainage metagenome TaxID=410659 RepID=A0A1J5R4C8_9ZZZZ